jgi:hypothetical protein
MPRSRFPKPSPSFVVACAALVVALVGNASAESNRQLKSTLHIYNGQFTTGVGDFQHQEIGCAKGQRVIGGGYVVTSGNFASVLGNYPTLEQQWGVAVLVPNGIAEPGVLPARFRVRVICADIGTPIVP